MTTALSHLDDARSIDGAQRKRFTVTEYRKLAEIGLLPSIPKTELIDGEIVFMLPTGRPHRSCVRALDYLLANHLSEERWTIFSQSTVEMDDQKAPEPDLCVLKGDFRLFETRDPEPHEYAYLIEVADSSLLYDRKTKFAMYAQMGIPCYWIVNLVERQLEAYEQPESPSDKSPRYARSVTYREQDTVTMMFTGEPTLTFRLADILPLPPSSDQR